MKTAFVETCDINKTHAQPAQTLGLDLVAAVNHDPNRWPSVEGFRPVRGK
jgi:hypothetical protein